MDPTDQEQEERRSLLRAWVQANGGHTSVVEKRRLSLGQASFLSQVVNGYSFGPRAARNMELRLGMPARYLEGSRPPEAKTNEIDLTDNPDFPFVRRVRFKLQAGVSAFAIEADDSNDQPIVFRRDWFQQHGYLPDKLLAARVNGASMEPTLYEGDLVVINTAQPQPKDARAFAANYEGEMVIKRLVHDAGQWWLRSDNSDKLRYPDKRCYEGVSFIGEVVYRQSEKI